MKKNFITLSGVEPNHKLTGKKQSFAVGGFLAAILLSAVGVVSLFKALVVLFGLLMFTGCLSFQDIKQRLLDDDDLEIPELANFNWHMNLIGLK